jgi:predicted metal-dependent hydrolase
MKELRKINIDDEIYDVKVFYERRNSSRISITETSILIRVPRHLNKEEQESHIKEFLEWAAKKIREKPIGKKSKFYNHLDLLQTHSNTYQIHIEVRDSKKNFTKIEGNRIYFKIADHNKIDKRQDHMSKQLQKHLAKNHHQDLVQQVKRINEIHFGKEVGKISYKYTRSRWGVCKIDKKEIELSTKLLLAPKEILEYVIIHELSHLIEPNHSRRFWNIVRSVDPNYKQKIKWLKVNGDKLVI